MFPIVNTLGRVLVKFFDFQLKLHAFGINGGFAISAGKTSVRCRVNHRGAANGKVK